MLSIKLFWENWMIAPIASIQGKKKKVNESIISMLAKLDQAGCSKSWVQLDTMVSFNAPLGYLNKNRPSENVNQLFLVI